MTANRSVRWARMAAVFGWLAFVAAATGVNGCDNDVSPPASGKIPLLVILWDPMLPDTQVRPTLAQVEELVFGAKPSISDFIANQSFGKANVRKAGAFSYLADKPADHYWNHPQPGTPGGDEFKSGHVEKWTEAIRKADQEFDFAKYDANGNGELTPEELGILIVIPQKSPFGTVRPVAGREYPSWQPLVVDGVKLTRIAEAYTGSKPNAQGSPMNFGVTAHELGHLFFGMFDFYGDWATRPGAYSLMDVTYTDAQYDPYHRIRAGWLKPQIVTRGGTYRLRSVETSGELLKISRPNHSPSEYFIIENRQHGDYDTQLPDTGLAIWRFIDDEGGDGWIHRNIHLIRSPVAQGDKLALWHAPESPSAALSWTDGTPSGISISGISESAPEMSLVIELR